MPLQVVSRLRTSDCSGQVNNMTANVGFEVRFSLGSAAGETEGMELVNRHRQGDRCLCRWCHGCSVQVNNMTANVRFEVRFSLGSAAGETEGMELVNRHRQGDRCLCRWCHG